MWQPARAGTLRPWKAQPLQRELLTDVGSGDRASSGDDKCKFADWSTANVQTDASAAACENAEVKDDVDRNEARRRIEAALKLSGLKASPLARAAGLASTTITRFLNNPEFVSVPGLRTIVAVEAAAAKIAAERLRHNAELGAAPLGDQPPLNGQNDVEDAALLRVWPKLSEDKRKAAMLYLEYLLSQAEPSQTTKADSRRNAKR